MESNSMIQALAKSRTRATSPNKSLLRSGGRWYLVCKQLAVIDKLPMISLGEPPAAELSRYAAGSVVLHESP
jgi:hypothetical protein